LLGMHAFALEETGDYDRALAAAHRSLELLPDNAAAIHVVAHVLEMRGPPDQGIAWLRGTQPIWIGNAGFRIHLAWHLALFQLDADAAMDALATYDDLIAPQLDGGNSGLVDASALLWRLQLRGNRSQRRWLGVTGLWMRRRTIGNRAFDLVHAVMAFAASKQHARARRLLERLKGDTMLRARSGNEELALAEPLITAIMSFGRGDYDGAVESISAILAAADRCGGSVAQCDLIHLTLLEAALRGHRKGLAQTLAAERAERKPESRLNHWLKARARALGAPRLAT
jgi:tetratricopeptide (TPR) repeat protein